MRPVVQVSEEVQAALVGGAAVVALESSIIAQGFPRPENLAIGRDLLAAVRGAGAVPAMIAVLDGSVRVGLSDAELERIATAPDVGKCSTRDLAWVTATGGSGGTTVAATARLALAAGIGVFATGGIGGVHRQFSGAPMVPDISADLPELGRTPIAVICSGAKSVLDLPATLELLETYGVPVIGYRTDAFPAFHAASSGLWLRQRIDDLPTLAAMVRAQRQLGLPGAVLVCNPPPVSVAMSREDVEALVQQALAEAAAREIEGAAVTPFLLAALDRLSRGQTRAVNRALAISNAELGAKLALALAGA